MTGPWVKQGDEATGGIFRLACHNKPLMVLLYGISLTVATGEGVKKQSRMPGYGLCKDTVTNGGPKKRTGQGEVPWPVWGGTRGRNEEGVFYARQAACHNSLSMVEDYPKRPSPTTAIPVKNRGHAHGYLLCIRTGKRLRSRKRQGRPRRTSEGRP